MPAAASTLCRSSVAQDAPIAACRNNATGATVQLCGSTASLDAHRHATEAPLHAAIRPRRSPSVTQRLRRFAALTRWDVHGRSRPCLDRRTQQPAVPCRHGRPSAGRSNHPPKRQRREVGGRDAADAVGVGGAVGGGRDAGGVRCEVCECDRAPATCDALAAVESLAAGRRPRQSSAHAAYMAPMASTQLPS